MKIAINHHRNDQEKVLELDTSTTLEYWNNRKGDSHFGYWESMARSK